MSKGREELLLLLLVKSTKLVGRQGDDGDEDEKEGTMSGFVLKPHSTPATLLWLQANYEAVEGVCIPRNAMYNQVLETFAH